MSADVNNRREPWHRRHRLGKADLKSGLECLAREGDARDACDRVQVHRLGKKQVGFVSPVVKVHGRADSIAWTNNLS